LDISTQKNRLSQFVDKVNKAGGTYHQMNIEELIIKGDYNMTKYVRYYRLPDSLAGKTVLDIGTASGYFAVECAKRGGEVTAIDIWDTPLLMELIEVTRLNIRYVKKSIYDLNESFGQFDLVICGSLLLHLPDQFGAIQRMRSVCRGKAVVSTACTPNSKTESRPVCEFTGQKALDGDYWAYWSISAVALAKMFLAAGFSHVDHQDHFTLSTERGRVAFATPHVIATGVI
jgi:2-polyprenyl-3-methyl-5-hydroxy-6-metoxy-1,4-benzoquinol methylase